MGVMEIRWLPAARLTANTHGRGADESPVIILRQQQQQQGWMWSVSYRGTCRPARCRGTWAPRTPDDHDHHIHVRTVAHGSLAAHDGSVFRLKVM